MSKKIKNTLKFIGFFTIGIVLLWLVYRDQNPEKIVQELRNINYAWILLSLVLGLFSHLSRARRWNLLLHPLGYRPRFANTFFAVMVMYLANLALPRMGEITRCGIMKRYEKVSFSNALGTVFTERIIDFIMLFALFIVVLVTQYDVILDFLAQNPGVGDKVNHLMNAHYLIWIVLLVMAGFVGLFFLFRQRIQKTVLYKKTADLAKNFWNGILTIVNLENKFEFILHSIFIYIMYFLMIYVCFFAFETTSGLSILTGLTVFVMASFGMVAPVQGGIGAWHFMAIGTLLIYQVPEVEAKAFALIVHGSMTLLLVVVGFISLLALPVYNGQKFNKRVLNEI